MWFGSLETAGRSPGERSHTFAVSGLRATVLSNLSAADCTIGAVRVLVVEDEERLAAAVRRGLVAEGFDVDVTGDGNDALWRAREGTYDAIVLDILLPGANGYVVCRTLRAEGNWTPILMLTAKDGELDEVEAFELGADDFLSKPFSFPVLVGAGPWCGEGPRPSATSSEPAGSCWTPPRAGASATVIAST